LHGIDWDVAVSELVDHLSTLLRFDTTNPPGNETPAAHWVAGLLRQEGIEAEVLESAPGRGTAIGRLRATNPTGEAPLLLMGHLDVVPAEPAEWQHPPFSGAVVGGEVWGRGALDMKSTVATWLMLVLLARRTGLPLKRDIILMANADEETGGDMGARWIAEHHFDKVRGAGALSEGGGTVTEIGGRSYFTYQVAEKTSCKFRMTARGAGGHASVPSPDNAVVHLGRAVAALGTTPLPVHITEPFRAFVEGVAAHQPEPSRSAWLGLLSDPAHADEQLAAATDDARLQRRLRAMMANTATPTMLQAGSKINVIPATAECMVDCRILPGQTKESVEAEVRAVLHAAGVLEQVELEWLLRPIKKDSPVHGPLVDAMRIALERYAPGVPLIPVMSTGGTDNEFFRNLGMPIYGFVPLPPGEAFGTIHAADERISTKALAFSLQVAWEVVRTFCA
jgi:acetylornithine deacetylase/succinyl-diaminopimelate desuccinylase-like protein